MTYTQKYDLATKPFLTITDVTRIMSSTYHTIKPMYELMVKEYKSKTGKTRPPWGMPNREVVHYFDIDVALLKQKASEEKGV